MTKKELLDKIKELFEDVSIFALMTVDSGYPVARPISGVIFHDEQTILIATARDSRKFEHIASQPKASLFLNDSEKYLNIKGIPSLEDNPELKDKYWRDSWSEYYSSGKESEEYCFFRLDIEHISYKDFLNDIDVEMDF